MKKKIITLFSLVCVLGNAYAQQDTTRYKFNALDYAFQNNRKTLKLRNNGFSANTFFKISGGFSYLSNFNAPKNPLRPTLNMEVGKWINGYNGISLAYNSSKVNDTDYQLYGINYLFNLSNFAQKQESKTFNVIAKFGTEAGSAEGNFIYGAKFGIEVSRYLTNNLSVFAEPTIGIYNDKLDHSKSWGGFDAITGFNIGLKYSMQDVYKPMPYDSFVQGLFAEIAYGGNFLYSEDIDKKKIGGTYRLSFGKWLIPSFGLRANLTTSNIQNVKYYDRKEDKELYYNSLGVDALLNLNQLTGGNKEFFEMNLIAGIGIGYSANKRYNKIAPLYNIGIQPKVNFNKFALFAEWNTTYNIAAFSKTKTITGSEKLGSFLFGVSFLNKEVDNILMDEKNEIAVSGAIGLNMVSTVWDQKNSDRIGGGFSLSYLRRFGINAFRVKARLTSIPSGSQVNLGTHLQYADFSLNYMYYLFDNDYIAVAPLVGVGYETAIEDEASGMNVSLGANISFPLWNNIRVFAEPTSVFGSTRKAEEKLRRYEPIFMLDLGIAYRF